MCEGKGAFGIGVCAFVNVLKLAYDGLVVVSREQRDNEACGPRGLPSSRHSSDGKTTKQTRNNQQITAFYEEFQNF